MPVYIYISFLFNWLSWFKQIHIVMVYLKSFNDLHNNLEFQHPPLHFLCGTSQMQHLKYMAVAEFLHFSLFFFYFTQTLGVLVTLIAYVFDT